MTEDEAWQLIEEKQKADQVNRIRIKAWDASGRFVDDYATQLGTMTLRKAFEMGFRFGYGDACMEQKK